MAVRPIDANALHTVISAWPESIMYKDWVQSAIATAPTLTPPNEWVSVEERLPEPGERVLAANGSFVGEAYLASNGTWMRHDGFPWEVDCWMPMPDRRPPEGEEDAADEQSPAIFGRI